MTFAATLMLLIVQITWGRALTWLLLPVPLVYAGVDIAENFLIAQMLATNPLTEEVVALASTFTVLKFILLAACLLVALFTLSIRPKPEGQATS